MEAAQQFTAALPPPAPAKRQTILKLPQDIADQLRELSVLRREPVTAVITGILRQTVAHVLEAEKHRIASGVA